VSGVERLFVYGSLRSEATRTRAGARRAFGLLSLGAAPDGPASVSGRLHAVSWYPGFTPGGRGRVQGELWAISSAGLLDALDAYEGEAYVRERLEATLNDGPQVTAWIYRYQGDLSGVPVIASGDYLQWLEAGTTPS
jgi:gamma-glutamylcyclotransferase (GGCT)/AIG2-like uncharacterized protein YtfP